MNKILHKMYKDSENGQMPTNMCTWTTPGKHLTLRTKPVVSSSLSVEPRSPCIVSCTVSSPMHDPVVQTFKWTCGSAQPVNDHVVGFLICTLQCFRPVACNLLLCEGKLLPHVVFISLWFCVRRVFQQSSLFPRTVGGAPCCGVVF